MTGQPHPLILYSFPTADVLADGLANFIIRAQKEGLNKHDKFTVAVSGGSLPKSLTALIDNPAVKWDKWQVYFADERAVSLDDEDSNYKLLHDTLLSKVPIPPSNVHPIDPTLIHDLEELSDAYEKELIKEFATKNAARFPVFDLILLGTGPDGHTASLFPGHELLSEDDRWVAYIENSPKPPPRRVTLTYPVINHAARVAFVSTNEAKKDILREILDEPEKGLPASRVRPAPPGQLYWFLDDAASQLVQYPKTEFKM
ncbi:6-phosphogluconolactonase [Peniophora sp. CONT]|nr:6-phosphogluconolactonase [Peniophora sp. CONT]